MQKNKKIKIQLLINCISYYSFQASPSLSQPHTVLVKRGAEGAMRQGPRPEGAPKFLFNYHEILKKIVNDVNTLYSAFSKKTTFENYFLFSIKNYATDPIAKRNIMEEYTKAMGREVREKQFFFFFFFFFFF